MPDAAAADTAAPGLARFLTSSTNKSNSGSKHTAKSGNNARIDRTKLDAACKCSQKHPGLQPADLIDLAYCTVVSKQLQNRFSTTQVDKNMNVDSPRIRGACTQLQNADVKKLRRMFDIMRKEIAIEFNDDKQSKPIDWFAQGMDRLAAYILLTRPTFDKAIADWLKTKEIIMHMGARGGVERIGEEVTKRVKFLSLSGIITQGLTSYWLLDCPGTKSDVIEQLIDGGYGAFIKIVREWERFCMAYRAFWFPITNNKRKIITAKTLRGLTNEMRLNVENQMSTRFNRMLEAEYGNYPVPAAATKMVKEFREVWWKHGDIEWYKRAYKKRVSNRVKKQFASLLSTRKKPTATLSASAGAKAEANANATLSASAGAKAEAKAEANAAAAPKPFHTNGLRGVKQLISEWQQRNTNGGRNAKRRELERLMPVLKGLTNEQLGAVFAKHSTYTNLAGLAALTNTPANRKKIVETLSNNHVNLNALAPTWEPSMNGAGQINNVSNSESRTNEGGSRTQNGGTLPLKAAGQISSRPTNTRRRDTLTLQMVNDMMKSSPTEFLTNLRQLLSKRKWQIDANAVRKIMLRVHPNKHPSQGQLATNVTQMLTALPRTNEGGLLTRTQNRGLLTQHRNTYINRPIDNNRSKLVRNRVQERLARARAARGAPTQHPLHPRAGLLDNAVLEERLGNERGTPVNVTDEELKQYSMV